MNEFVNLVNIQRITKEINEIYRDGSAYGGGDGGEKSYCPSPPKVGRLRLRLSFLDS